MQRAGALSLFLTIACIGSAVSLTAQSESSEDLAALFDEGQALADAGDWEGALASWEASSEQLSGEGLHDPRIGIAFFELATEHEAEEQYDTASDLYLWSLGWPSIPEGERALEEEIERLTMLWSEAEEAAFDELRSDPERLRIELRRYWIEKDPTPSTAVNERLVEHWSRIRDARRRFTYNRSSPIQTDDRGIVYVRFGQPGRSDRGSLGASELEMRVRIPGNAEGRQALRRYDTNPQYEVWVYDELNTEGFTYFLFGNIGGSGPFELVDGVSDLIPEAAKSRSSAQSTPGGIPAAFYLELFYYQDLAVVGGHFGRRFQELTQRWDDATYKRNSFASASRSTPSEGDLEALRFRYDQEDRYFPPTPPQMEVLSDFEGDARDELVGQMIRTLSDDNVPLLVTVGTSAPRLVASVESAYEGDLAFPEWVMRHTLVIRDSRLDEVGRFVQPLSAFRADASAFVVRHVPEPLHLTLTARTLRISENREDTLVAGDRLPGSQHFVPEAPLSTDTTQFVISDLLTGTPIPPGINANSLPYPLLPTTQIWRRDPLRVYMELFNIGEVESARGELDVRFVVVPLDEALGVDFDRDPVTLSVALSPRAGQPYRESFDMQLRDQELGFYRVEIEITDRARNQTVQRSALIELVN